MNPPLGNQMTLRAVFGPIAPTGAAAYFAPPNWGNSPPYRRARRSSSPAARSTNRTDLGSAVPGFRVAMRWRRPVQLKPWHVMSVRAGDRKTIDESDRVAPAPDDEFRRSVGDVAPDRPERHFRRHHAGACMV